MDKVGEEKNRAKGMQHTQKKANNKKENRCEFSYFYKWRGILNFYLTTKETTKMNCDEAKCSTIKWELKTNCQQHICEIVDWNETNAIRATIASKKNCSLLTLLVSKNSCSIHTVLCLSINFSFIVIKTKVNKQNKNLPKHW